MIKWIYRTLIVLLASAIVSGVAYALVPTNVTGAFPQRGEAGAVAKAPPPGGRTRPEGAAEGGPRGSNNIAIGEVVMKGGVVIIISTLGVLAISAITRVAGSKRVDTPVLADDA